MNMTIMDTKKKDMMKMVTTITVNKKKVMMITGMMKMVHDEHGHEEDGHDDHGHEGHAHGEYDPHIWLDPANAKNNFK